VRATQRDRSRLVRRRHRAHPRRRRVRVTATLATTTYEYDIPEGKLRIALPGGTVLFVYAFEVIEDHESPEKVDAWVGEVNGRVGRNLFVKLQFGDVDPEAYEPFLRIHRDATASG